MVRRFIAVILSVTFVAGLALAQDKAAQPEKKAENPMQKKNPIVEIQTNHGNIYLEVFENETPIHAKNFLSKVDAGKYDKLTFHRIVPGFVIQGGDPSGNGTGSMPGDPLPDEKSPFPELRGTVAMARSNAASNCQFYINLKDNTRLDEMKFSAFAKVVQGMDVVDEIAKVKNSGPPNNSAVEPVIMNKLQRVDKLPAVKPVTTEKAPAQAPDKK